MSIDWNIRIEQLQGRLSSVTDAIRTILAARPDLEELIRPIELLAETKTPEDGNTPFLLQEVAVWEGGSGTLGDDERAARLERQLGSVSTALERLAGSRTDLHDLLREARSLADVPEHEAYVNGGTGSLLGRFIQVASGATD